MHTKAVTHQGAMRCVDATAQSFSDCQSFTAVQVYRRTDSNLDLNSCLFALSLASLFHTVVSLRAATHASCRRRWKSTLKWLLRRHSFLKKQLLMGEKKWGFLVTGGFLIYQTPCIQAMQYDKFGTCSRGGGGHSYMKVTYPRLPGSGIRGLSVTNHP